MRAGGLGPNPSGALGAVALALAFLALGPIGRSVAQAPGADPAEALWRRALSQSDADSAAFLYELLVARHERSPRARQAQLELADLHFSRGAYREAFRHYAAAAGKGSLGERARLGEARSRYALAQYPEARQAAGEAMRSPDPRVAWSAGFLVALAWQAEGRTREALSEYLRLLDRPPGPEQPSALLAAARAARSEGRREQAERFLAALHASYPRSYEALEADTVMVSRPAAERALP